MATENKLQDYELMVIFTPVLADEDFTKQLKRSTQDFIKDKWWTTLYTRMHGDYAPSAYPIARKRPQAFTMVLEFHGSFRSKCEARDPDEPR